MKFKVEDQYPQKWIHGDLQEKPLDRCKLEDDPDFPRWQMWTVEIDSVEQLIELAKEKEAQGGLYDQGCNIFIDVKGRRIVFTNQGEPE